LDFTPPIRAFLLSGSCTVRITLKPSGDLLLAFTRLVLPTPVPSARQRWGTAPTACCDVAVSLAISFAEVFKVRMSVELRFAFPPRAGCPGTAAPAQNKVIDEIVVLDDVLHSFELRTAGGAQQNNDQPNRYAGPK
jgi:hypothetical protein